MRSVLEKYNGPTFIAGALMIGYGHNAEMLYAGMNKDFRSFKPQYLSHFQRFLYLFDAGYTYVNMGGVEGTLNDGLTLYKSKYNATVREYIGEFDLPVHPFLYKIQAASGGDETAGISDRSGGRRNFCPTWAEVRRDLY